MAECWIGTNNATGSTGEVAVGCCCNCQVHACNNHGDRLTKSQFWCFICLQRPVVNSAGLFETEEEEPELLASTSFGSDEDFFGQSPRLRAELEYEMSEAGDMLSGLDLEHVADGRYRDVTPGLLHVGVALAIRSVGGSAELVEGAQRGIELRAFVHSGLLHLLATSGPRLA